MYFKYVFNEGDTVLNKSGHPGVVLEFIPHLGYSVKAINGVYEYQFIIGGRDLNEGRWNHRTMQINNEGFVGNNPEGNILCSGRLGQLWKGIFDRCYGTKYLAKNKTYIGSSVCGDWHDFQKFARDVQAMPNYASIDLNGKNYYLDKDILTGTMQYSKETCVFVPQLINAYFRDLKAELTHSITRNNKYKLTIAFNGKRTRGTFETYEECNAEYRRLFAEKGLAIIELYKNSVDERVIKAIEATL